MKKNLLLLFFSTFLSLFVAELIIAKFLPVPTIHPISVTSGNGEHSLSLNKKLIYVPRPNTGEFNAKGYRGAVFPYERTPGKKRIIFMGDSVTEGLGVDYEKRFTDLLSQKMGPKYELINLSVRGYNLRQEIEYLIEYGFKYKPDVVLMCITFNDLEIHAGEVHWFEDKMKKMRDNAFYSAYYRKKGKIEEALLRFNIYRYFYLLTNQWRSKQFKADESFYKSVYYKMDQIQINDELDELVQWSLRNDFKLGFIFLPLPRSTEDKQIILLRDMVGKKTIERLDLFGYTKENYRDEELKQLFRDPCHLSEKGHLAVSELIGKKLNKW